MELNDLVIMILKIYQEQKKNYGEVLALENVSERLKEQFGLSENEVLQWFKNLKQSKFCTIWGENTPIKINFITLPKWGTKVKFYKLTELSFSHLIVTDFEG